MATTTKPTKNQQLRKAMLDMLMAGEDPQFVRFAFGASGAAELEEIDDNLKEFASLMSGSPMDGTEDNTEIGTQFKKELQQSVESRKQLIVNLKQYKSLIDAYGFETGIGEESASVLGELQNLRGEITANYKKAEKLGALDTGVLRLVKNIIGQEPKIGFGDEEEGFSLPTLNIGGWKSARASAALQSAIENAESTLEADTITLTEGFDPLRQRGNKAKKTAPSFGGDLESFQAAMKMAESNPEDPNSKMFLEAVNSGKIDRNTGRIVTGNEEPTETLKGGSLKGTMQEKNGPTGTPLVDEDGAFVTNFYGVEKPQEGATLYDRFAFRAKNLMQIPKKQFEDMTKGSLLGRMKDQVLYNGPGGKAGLAAAGQVAGAMNDVIGSGITSGISSVWEQLPEDKRRKMTEAMMQWIDSPTGELAMKAFEAGADVFKTFEKTNPEDAQRVRDVANVLSIIPASKAGHIIRDQADNIIHDIGVLSRGPKGLSGQTDDLAKKVAEGARPLINIDDLSGVAREKAQEAVKQGFEPKDVGMLVSMAPEDRAVAGRMLKLADDANVNPRILQRPIDLAGETLTGKLKVVTENVKRFGKEVDDAAKSLRGKIVDASEIGNKAGSLLDDMGITVGSNGDLVFENSVFKNTPAIQNLMQRFYKAMPQGETDAYQLHIFKKSIDELVNYGEKGEGLKGQSRTFLKALRHSADEILDNNFESYNAANTEFREAIEIAESAEELFGKKYGLDSTVRAGQVLRSAFSNNQSRGNVYELAKELDNYLLRKTGDAGMSALDQAMFAEIMEKSGLFKTQAITGFAGGIETAVGKALQGTSTVINAIQNPVSTGLGAIGKGIEHLRKVTPEMKRQILDDLTKGVLGASKEVDSLRSPLFTIRPGMTVKDVTQGDAKAYQFVSPNAADDALTLDDAIRNLDTPEYAKSADDLERIYGNDGITGQLERGIGDWSDGAEQTFIKKIIDDVPDDRRIYSLAKGGKLLKQKDVIDFKVDFNGPDDIYVISRGTVSDTRKVKQLLEEAGITFKTMGDGNLYVINKAGEYFDGTMLDKMEKISNAMGVDVEHNKGFATFVTGLSGGPEVRDQAIRVYDDIISKYESYAGNNQGGKFGGGEGVPVFREPVLAPQEEIKKGLKEVKGKKTIVSKKGQGAIPQIAGKRTLASKDDPLLQEARKYKSAEEFVKAQNTYFRGVNEAQPRKNNAPLEFGKGLYITESPQYAQSFGTVSEYSLPKSTQLIDAEATIPTNVLKSILSNVDSQTAKYIENNLGGNKTFRDVYRLATETTGDYAPVIKAVVDNGFSGVQFLAGKTLGQKQFPSTVLYKPEEAITKSQLTDLWKKAHKK